MTAALTLLAARKLPFVSVLTDPTMGGVSASFAMMALVGMLSRRISSV